MASHATFPVIARLFKHDAQGNFHLTHSLDIYHPGGIQALQQNAALRPEPIRLSCFVVGLLFKVPLNRRLAILLKEKPNCLWEKMYPF